MENNRSGEDGKCGRQYFEELPEAELRPPNHPTPWPEEYLAPFKNIFTNQFPLNLKNHSTKYVSIEHSRELQCFNLVVRGCDVTQNVIPIRICNFGNIFITLRLKSN